MGSRGHFIEKPLRVRPEEKVVQELCSVLLTILSHCFEARRIWRPNVISQPGDLAMHMPSVDMLHYMRTSVANVLEHLQKITQNIVNHHNYLKLSLILERERKPINYFDYHK